eukprot:TRINITY_DN1465_c0_g1_i2.p1 TRINITY_DN1465_c0_g1~~TRINITY_DN1465_c0_g1_i2.p1  ORF type:complete len:658 (-),score=127.14 TRINITY_DN1465_c0_g1_i2:80-2053(-)
MIIKGSTQKTIINMGHWSLFLLLIARTVGGYTIGAPDSACSGMQPGHGFDPKPLDESPFNIQLASKSVEPGGALELKLLSSTPFKGFILQARNASDPDSQLGSFETNSGESKYMTCGKGIHNSITHQNNNLKTEVSAKWFAPNDAFDGEEVIFVYSGLVLYDSYWVRMESEPVRFVKREVEETTISLLPTRLPNERLNNVTLRTTSQSTTSTTTTTTTTTTASTTTSEPNQIDSEHPIYDGCGLSKSCFGMPRGCVNTKDCSSMVSYELNGLNLKFNLIGKSSGYISVGLSDDTRMGDDLTTSCFYDFNLDKIDVISGYNEGYSNKVLKPPQVGIVPGSFSGSYEDGFIACSFEREEKIVLEERKRSYSLLGDQYVLFIANGPYVDGSIRQHRSKLTSGEKQALGLTEKIAGKSRLFLILHGSLMIGAWIFAAPIGMIISRYFKKTWTAQKLLKRDAWFLVHWFLMIAVINLTIVGVVLIFMELEFTWSAVPIRDNPHALLGIITTGLVILQLCIALLRCGPSSPKRPLFNWVHWFLGNSAYILALVTIFFAVDLDKALLPKEMDWILVSFVGFHFFVHLTFNILSACGSSKSKDVFPGRGSYPDYDELKRDAPGSGSRKFMLSFYIIINLIISSTLILFVIFAPISDFFKSITKLI